MNAQSRLKSDFLIFKKKMVTSDINFLIVRVKQNKKLQIYFRKYNLKRHD